MKLNQLLRESANVDVTNDLVERYFDIDGDVEIKDNIVNVNGSVFAKTGKKFTKVPFKFGSVSETFDVMDTGLISCENFPLTAGQINISINRKLTSFDGLEKTTCDDFEASDLDSLASFANAPEARTYVLSRCKSVTSTEGLPTTRLEVVNLSGIPNLVNVKNIVQNLHRATNGTSRIEYSENLPLVMLTVCSGQTGYLEWDIINVPKKLESLLIPYRGKGIQESLELILALKNSGFASNAKLR
jgi:hypothetical protein